MSQQLSRWWLLGPPFSIVVALFAYYAVFPSFRGWVDSHVPWVATHIGIYIATRDSPERIKRSKAALESAHHEPTADLPPTPAPATPVPLKPIYLTADGTADLARLAANRADWPKVVVLRAPKEFPAVVGGRAAGKIIVPKGTEVNLLKIEASNVGVEYKGGGAWVGADDTDLADRLRTVLR